MRYHNFVKKEALFYLQTLYLFLGIICAYISITTKVFHVIIPIFFVQNKNFMLFLALLQKKGLHLKTKS